MNACLADRCRANGFDFVDMNDGFADTAGFMSREFWADDHHVAARHYLELERRLMRALDQSPRLTGG